MTLDPLAALEGELEALASDQHCADGRGAALDLISLLLPPEDISTVECASTSRYLKNPEGGGVRLYSVARTPYMTGPMNALDDPRYRMVIVVGPERSGKSVGGECYLHKCLRNGPSVDAIIYLQAKSDVDSYSGKEFYDLVSLHPEIHTKIPGWPKQSSNNQKQFKRVAGRVIQLLPANDGNLRQKEAPLIIATEIDGWRPSVRAKAVQEIRGRQKSFGNQAKAYLESHPDVGWTGGIAAAWLESTRGIFYWPCPECDCWSSPHPLAQKGMRMALDFTRDDALDDQARLDKVAATARLLCPHCGSTLDDAQRDRMVDLGTWIFQGQVIAEDGTITGAPIEHDTAGFWIHGTMSKVVSLGSIAKELVSATIAFERTRKPDRLKRARVKTLGEVHEGAGSKGFDPKKLRERVVEADNVDGFMFDTVPDDVLFVTAAVDVGGSKFDVMIVGWDIEGRAWIISRFTIRQRMVGANMIDLRPRERIDDWDVLEEQVLNRVLPLASDPDMRMPVAAMTIDNGDGNATWKAREFARRMANRRQHWGSQPPYWQKVKLIKGVGSPDAPELSDNKREINVDDHGRRVAPTIIERDLGVFKLKEWTLECLALENDGPGYVRFADGLPGSTFDEFGGEALIDGKWERRGPNESLDLFGYNKAARLMLSPDRAKIDWTRTRPVWARPLRLARQGQQLPATPQAAPVNTAKSVFDRFADLNNGD